MAGIGLRPSVAKLLEQGWDDDFEELFLPGTKRKVRSQHLILNYRIYWPYKFKLLSVYDTPHLVS